MRGETAEAMTVVVRADGSAGSYMDRVSREEVEEANTPVARSEESSDKTQHHSSADKNGMAAAQNSKLLSSRPGFQAGGNRTTFESDTIPTGEKSSAFGFSEDWTLIELNSTRSWMSAG